MEEVAPAWTRACEVVGLWCPARRGPDYRAGVGAGGRVGTVGFHLVHTCPCGKQSR